MQKREWLLVYLSLPSKDGKIIIDPIRIMKGLFLFKMECEGKLNNFYEFEPYLYGPYSLEVYDDLLKLKSATLIDESSQSSDRWSYYRVTKKGDEGAEKLKASAEIELLNKLKDIKMRVTSLSFLDLLKEVYTEHPKYAERSIITFKGVV